MIEICVTGREVAYITRCEGVMVVEPCRYILHSGRADRRKYSKQRRCSPVDAVGPGAIPRRPATPSSNDNRLIHPGEALAEYQRQPDHGPEAAA